MYYLVTNESNTVTLKAKSEQSLTKYRHNLACDLYGHMAVQEHQRFINTILSYSQLHVAK